MIRPPFAARVAVGLAVTVVDEARRLPSTAISLPMTAISQVLQTSMRFQQTVTELAIRGDEIFALIGNAPEEKASWATFDDDDSGPALSTEPELLGDTSGEIDVPEPEPAPPAPEAVATSAPESGAAAGRFALYSTPPSEIDVPAAPAPKKAAKRAPKKAPEIAEYLDYDSLTLAQLRARLRTLSVDELTTLLDYESASASRAPFLTMLTNRITTAQAK
ncbi:lipid droplet-associated protein [Actinomycetes bacterium M1A6_2h]